MRKKQKWRKQKEMLAIGVFVTLSAIARFFLATKERTQ
jgi:hypothetical protein